TTATFTNLDPGDYVFEIRTSNNNGVWNEKGAAIKVYVHPPIWRTMYAYIFYVLLLIGTMLYLRHLGIQKIKKKFALGQEKIMDMYPEENESQLMKIFCKQLCYTWKETIPTHNYLLRI
ncbi:MAG: triple tyrosine motif-containing protein, partial [Ferruginibacter sp.]